MNRLQKVSLATTLIVLLLIVVGGYVTATGSGDACPDWPTCHGRIVPEFTTPVLIEYSHRLVASVAGFAVLALAIVAHQSPRQPRSIVWLSRVALVLVPMQIILGGLRVRNPGIPDLVVLHLAIGSLFFGSLTALTALAFAGNGTDARMRTPEPAGFGETRETWKDYWLLAKPRILFLLVLAALASMIVAAGRSLTLDNMFYTLLGGTLAAASANALNNYFEVDVDSRMHRTMGRPLPAGRVDRGRALLFSLILASAAVIILVAYVNVLSAALAVGGLLFYVVIYTLALKRRTPQNIVIGGAAGMFPALVGWAGATGELSWAAVLLGFLVFLWTPPHFWALAIVYKEDYARANIPMMPNVVGDDATRKQMVAYSVVLLVASILFYYPLGVLREVYLASALILGVLFLYLTILAAREKSIKSAKRLFHFSILYLTALYVMMVVERLFIV
ncbi:MAG: protoheme IX farnesyltransferase [Euryarchaeota archaeon]|nr:protoheme IX farnesyltransferase [Euryarchaeota archaeon]